MSAHPAGPGGATPWVVGHPQPAIQTLADTGRLTGAVLDIGCGIGEHTLLAAALGHVAVGIDLDETALGVARETARRRGLDVTFMPFDARQLARVPAEFGSQFDTVIDSELFHMLDDADRADYVTALRSVLTPGGRYFMLGFSDAQPDVPHTLSHEQIAAAFAGWQIDSIEPVIIDTQVHPNGARGWLLSATLTGRPAAAARAHVDTSRASRYLTQLCDHLERMADSPSHGSHAHLPTRAHRRTPDAGPVRANILERSETRAVIHLGRGRCTVLASDTGLTVSLEADHLDDLQQLQALIAHRLEQVGRRDKLTVTWTGPTPA